MTGAAPRLSGAAAYATWSPLFLNWLGRSNMRRTVEMETKGMKALMEAVGRWEDEEVEESIRAALEGASISSSSLSGFPSLSSASPMKVKREDAEAAASAKTTKQKQRSVVAKLVADSQRVYSVLYECLPEELRTQVCTLDSDSFALWRWLENKFQSKEADNVGELLRQWNALSMDAEESFDAYRARVVKLHSLLAAAKETISPAQFSLVLLDRLQPRFNQVVLALDTSGQTKDAAKIDWDAVASTINAFERKEQRMNGGEETMRAAAAYGRQKQSRQQQQQQQQQSSSSSSTQFIPRRDKGGPPPHILQNMSCYNCGGKGHLSRNCSKKNASGQEGQQRGPGKETAAAAMERTQEHEGEQEEHEFAFSTLASPTKPPVNRSVRFKMSFAERAMGLSQVPARRPLSLATSAASASPSPPLAVALKRLVRPGEEKKPVPAAAAKPAAPAVIREPSPPRRSQAAEAAARAVPPPRFKKQSLDAALASTAWGVDTMASVHISGNRKLFSNLKNVAHVEVQTIEGLTKVLSNQLGTISLRVWSEQKQIPVQIKVEDVYYSDRVSSNLLSWVKLSKLGWKLQSNSDESSVTTPGGNKVVLSTRGRVLVMEHEGSERVYSLTTKAVTTADELVRLHERLGHMGFDRMIEAMKAETTLDLGELHASSDVINEARMRCQACVACVTAKGTKQPLGSSGLDKGSDTIDVLHLDSFEAKFERDGQQVVEYGLAMRDPHSGGVWFAKATTKDLLPQIVIDIIRSVQTQTGKRVKRIHSDGGSEFINATMKSFCKSNGSELHYSPARTPQLNGVAEKCVRLLKEGGRTLLEHAKLPSRYWAHSISHFVYVWNRLKVGLTGVTPFEAMRGKKPSAKYLGVFGADVWSHLPREKRMTFDAKMEPGVYLGHDDAQNCPIVLLIQSGKVIRTKDVKFPKKPTFTHAAALRAGRAAIDHTVSLPFSLSEDELELLEECPTDSATACLSHYSPPGGASSGANSRGGNATSETEDSKLSDGEFQIERIVDKRGSGNKARYLVHWAGYPNRSDFTWEPFAKLSNAKEAIRAYEDGENDTDHDDDSEPIVHMVMCAIGPEQETGVRDQSPSRELVLAVKAAIDHLETQKLLASPETFTEAMESPAADKWQAAMDKEMKSCEDAGTWTRVRRADLLPNANVIPCKWVYKVKNDETGTVTEHKARLTPKGFKQKKGVDYDEVFARTGMYKTLRVGLALAAAWGYELDQLDVPSAFLNAPIKEELYMEMPEGYGEEGFVFRLLKALYGLKQAPRAWYLMVSRFIKEELLFTECVSDPCLFFLLTKTGRLLLLFLFVDDFQVGYHRDDREEWEQLKQLLIDRFRTKDMGESKWILGMRIQRDRAAGTLTLDQELYVTKALEKFGLNECKPMSTPALSAAERETDEDGAGQPADHAKYMEIVGTLLYATISTRLDISYAVQKLTRQMQAPLKRHMVAAERVLRYLAGTKELGLTFGRVNEEERKSNDELLEVEVLAFADADWANDKLDRKSITGWVAKLNGDVISWASKKQRTVAQSSCEAELYAEAAAINEVIWLRGLLAELGLRSEKPSLIIGDNQGTIALSKNGVKSERTKHVDVKFHFITEEVNKKTVELKWVPSEKQQADIFTKALAKPLFEKFRGELMSQLEGAREENGEQGRKKDSSVHLYA